MGGERVRETEGERVRSQRLSCASTATNDWVEREARPLEGTDVPRKGCCSCCTASLKPTFHKQFHPVSHWDRNMSAVYRKGHRDCKEMKSAEAPRQAAGKPDCLDQGAHNVSLHMFFKGTGSAAQMKHIFKFLYQCANKYRCFTESNILEKNIYYGHH